jgi:hypothetical protein
VANRDPSTDAGEDGGGGDNSNNDGEGEQKEGDAARGGERGKSCRLGLTLRRPVLIRARAAPVLVGR